MMYLDNSRALRALQGRAVNAALELSDYGDANRRRECLNRASRLRALADESTLTRLIKDHTQDEDCMVDPATDLCYGCGSLHGEPCAACGQRAFHRDDCPIFQEQSGEWSDVGRLKNWNVLNIPLGFAALAIVFSIAYGIATHFSH